MIMNPSQSTSSEPLAPHRRTLLPHIQGGTEAPDVQTANAYTEIAADPAVRKLAMQCRRECEALIQEAGYEHFIAATVMGTAMHGCTPAEWLESELELIRAEAAAIKEEHARASARRRAEKDSRRPLEDAISKRQFAAQARKEGARRLLSELARPRRQERTGENLDRWNALVQAGMTPEQIRLVGDDRGGVGDPAEAESERLQRAESHRIAVHEADRLLEAIAAWRADPLRRIEHLRGVGLDDLLAQFGHAQVAEAQSA
jgi:hypothetical protein